MTKTSLSNFVISNREKCLSLVKGQRVANCEEDLKGDITNKFLIDEIWQDEELYLYVENNLNP